MEGGSHERHAQHLLETGLFSDCTIKCQDRTWRTHRAILVPRCEFFRACFTSGFQEALPDQDAWKTSNDSQLQLQADHVSNRIVTMHEDDPEALERMFKWIYTLSYPAQITSIVSDKQGRYDIPATFWTSELTLILLADKYDLLPLVRLSVVSLLSTAQAHISDPQSAHDCQNFLSCIDNFADMLEMLFTMDAVSSVSSALGFDLRVELLEYTGAMVAKFISNEPALESLLQMPDFGIVLVQVLGGITDGPASDLESTKIQSRQERHGTENVLGRKRVDIETTSQREGLTSNSQGSSFSSRQPSFEIIIRSSQRRRALRARQDQPSPDENLARPKTIHVPMNEDSDLD